MKRFTFILTATLLFLCVLAGCSNQNKSEGNTQTTWDLTDAEPVYVTEWPENEYTSQIVKPEYGEMDYIFDFSDSGRYALFLKEISEEESKEYIEQLKEAGFSETFSEGNQVSVGTILEKDDVFLSIAFSDGILAMTITMEK